MQSQNVICGVNFGPLTPGGHLWFCDKWKILTQAYLKGQVVFPCQNLSKSDEREPNAEPKCDLWGQIWSILDLWPPAAILDFALTDKFVLKLVIGVKKYVHAIFCPNLMKEIHMPSQNVIVGSNWSILDIWTPAAILHFAINKKFLNMLFLGSMPNFVKIRQTETVYCAKM